MEPGNAHAVSDFRSMDVSWGDVWAPVMTRVTGQRRGMADECNAGRNGEREKLSSGDRSNRNRPPILLGDEEKEVRFGRVCACSGSLGVDVGDRDKFPPFVEFDLNSLGQISARSPFWLQTERSHLTLQIRVGINLFELVLQLIAHGSRRVGRRQQTEPIRYDEPRISGGKRRHARQ